MPKTLTCKKCGFEAPVCDMCPQCGAKLNPNQAHLLWRLRRQPALDWMCWNAVCRIALPIALAIMLALVVMQLILTGPAGLEAFLCDMLPAAGIALLVFGLLVLLALFLRGEEIIECVADQRGVSLRVYLQNATPLKLYLRFRSPELLEKPGADRWLLVSTQSVTWKETARVQIWYEKHMILFYSPRRWLRVCLPGEPATWPEFKALIREKLGKSKTVQLPPELRVPARPKSKAPRANQHPEPFSGPNP